MKNSIREPESETDRPGSGTASPRPRKRGSTVLLREFELRIGRRFRDRSLLEAALTHPTYRFENPGSGPDNQRLEFLGDAVLSLAASESLFRTFPDLPEGPLTETRSRWIRTGALAEIARAIGIGPLLKLGRGETLTGGADRDRTLEDALEAVLGAVYLDGGWRAVQRVFDQIFVPRIPDAGQGIRHHNPKGALQEICQSRWKKSPEYRTVEEAGPAHRKHYSVEVRFEDRILGRGTGPSLRAAQKEAAEQALGQLEPVQPAQGGSSDKTESKSRSRRA